MIHKPISAHAGTLPNHSGFYVLADDDQRKLEGPFRTMQRAIEVAEAVSSGAKWRWEAGD